MKSMKIYNLKNRIISGRYKPDALAAERNLCGELSLQNNVQVRYALAPAKRAGR